jgi:hypothetical protein
MKSREKTVKLLESFLSDKEVDGVCGYMVDPDGEGPIQVIVVLDINYIQEANTKPGFIARMIREGVKQEIKKWLGLNIYVGSTAKKCDEIEPLSESMAPHVKRRLSNVKILDELTTILDYEVNIENFNNASDAVEEIVNMLNERILDEIWETTHRKVSLAEKDELYWHIYDRFNKFITHRYNETQEMNESKKKYIVTESQYNLISESQKHIQIFQDLIDNEMAYIRRVCEKGADDYEGDVGDESCNQIESVEKVTVTDADWVTVMHSNQPLEQKYMSIKLMIYFSSIRRGDFDADDLTYDLERIIRKKTSMPVIINYESTNTNTSFEW